jgi:hypothetical protein
MKRALAVPPETAKARAAIAHRSSHCLWRRRERSPAVALDVPEACEPIIEAYRVPQDCRLCQVSAQPVPPRPRSAPLLVLRCTLGVSSGSRAPLSQCPRRVRSTSDFGEIAAAPRTGVEGRSGPAGRRRCARLRQGDRKVGQQPEKGREMISRPLFRLCASGSGRQGYIGRRPDGCIMAGSGQCSASALSAVEAALVRRPPATAAKATSAAAIVITTPTGAHSLSMNSASSCPCGRIVSTD